MPGMEERPSFGVNALLKRYPPAKDPRTTPLATPTPTGNRTGSLSGPVIRAGRPLLMLWRALTWPFRASCRCLRSLRLWKGFLVFALVVMLLFTPRSTHVLSPVDYAVRGYEYNLVGWEVSNFLDKWVHRVRELIPGVGSSEQEKREDLDRYIELNEEITVARDELRRVAAEAESDDDELALLQDRVDELVSERRGLRNDVEEFLESAIDAVLREMGIGELGPLTWPPVDFRLDSTPRVLITSPRDRIKRLESVLLDPGVTLAERGKIEEKFDEGSPDLSVIVLGTGGVATFPTVIPDDRDLLSTLDVAAHEWLHAYLIFRPLGQAYWDSEDLTTLNETLSNLFGEEVGRAAYERVTGETLPPLEPFIPEEPSDPGVMPDGEEDTEGFTFWAFMRETRLRTDDLLADGDIDGAETYMEQRRVDLQEHGIFIRKINQAYFAFNGSYGDNPASVSPIGAQLQEFRTYVENAGDLVKVVQGADSYEDFLERLDRQRSAHGVRTGG